MIKMTNQNFDKLSCYDDLIGCLRSLEDLFLLMGAVDRREERLVYACSEIGMVLTAKFRDLLGQMIRTAYASGANAIILSKRDWSLAEPTLMKSSAGAYDRIMIVQLDKLEEDLALIKSQGYSIVVTHREETSMDFMEYDYPFPMVLAFGGEFRGLSRAVLQARDVSLKINYPKQTKLALNAVSASAIICFEVYRKRKP